MRTVVVAGASGLVGQAAVQAFLDAGWRVLALSRRPPAAELSDRLVHLPLDLNDAPACAAALAREPGVSHLVYAAVQEAPGLVSGWTDRSVMQANLVMLENVLTPLAAGGAMAHVSILQGGKAYGAHLHSVPVPVDEDAPRDPHENFYWLQEDAVRAAADGHGFRFTVLRPPLVIGGATGSVMNVLIPIALYGALCRELGLPFGFPGGATSPFDVVDARVVGAALLWAADAPGAANQTFNVGAGEPADWRSLWPTLAEALGLPAGGDRPQSLVRFLSEHAGAWRRLAERCSLAEPDLAALLGESHHYADLLFAPGAEAPSPPFFMSTIKIREAGFQDCMRVRETFRFWLDDLVRRRIIPPARG